MGTYKKGDVQAESNRVGGDVPGKEADKGKLFRVWDGGGKFIT